MNIISIPFHNWRKIRKEGFRTRDSHLIREMKNMGNVDNQIIINRPITLIEIILKRYLFNLGGVTIYKKGWFTLSKIDQKTFVIDYVSWNWYGLLKNKEHWFYNAFSNPEFIAFVNESLQKLGIDEFTIINHNLFAFELCRNVNRNMYIFDAYDNLLLIPAYVKSKDLVIDLYHRFALDKSCKWVTNSTMNQKFFKEEYGRNGIPIITNGVNFEVFQKEYPKPEELKKFKNKVVGFGGKITHLIDVDLFKCTIESNPDLDFIIVGQILEDNIFKQLKIYKNLHYLGDKPYSIYPSYATNFDVAIIPYITDKQKTYGDSIKAYEFIAAGVPIVGTRGNGLETLDRYLYLASDKHEFAQFVREGVKQDHQKQELSQNHSWGTKAQQMISHI